MTSASGVEVQRISRLLGSDPDDIAFLERIDAPSLRLLRHQLVDVVFDPDAGRLGTLRSAARMLPPPVTARIAERALGPVLCGHLAGALDDGHAAAIARRLPPEFLAEVAGHVHPDRVEIVVGRLHSHQVEAAADVLAAREDLLALGHFAGIIREDTLQAVVARLDAATILDIAPYVEPIERVDRIVGSIDDPVLLAVLRAAHSDRRWGDAFDLVGCLSEPTRGRLAVLAVPEADLIDGAVRAAAETDRWTTLLSFAVLADEVPGRHWSDVGAFADRAIIVAAVEAADREDLWAQFTTLTSYWPDDLRRHVATIVPRGARDRLGL
ncbi:MAG: hypothetical protein JST64_07335 [Actinobacteria bacterium]|nr:hypothetical protein [Actinomycetota bacterium]